MSTPKSDCRCEACVPSIDVAYEPTDTRAWLNYRMIVCGMCGNKRCPHATDHRNACTDSNEPGQAGSSYEQCSKFARSIKPSPAPVQPDTSNSLESGGIKSVQASVPATVPGQANIGTAPAFLNTNDKAFWILGWNACRDAAMKGTL